MKESSDNTMAPHFRKAVVEIDQDIYKLNQDIDRLRCTRNTLVELYGGDEELPPVETIAPTAVQTGGPEKGRRETKRARAAKSPGAGGAGEALHAGTARGPERTSPAATGRAPTADIIKMMGVARTCPEPFTAPSLAVATGFAQKALGSHLFRWQQRGWIVKVGRGEYKRTGTFPTETPNQ